MKNKARHRNLLIIGDKNGVHKNKEGFTKKNKETRTTKENDPKNRISLELFIFRTLFAVFTIGLIVYGLYILNISNNNNDTHKLNSEDSFVELDSDDSDETVRSSVGEPKELHSEQRELHSEQKENMKDPSEKVDTKPPVRKGVNTEPSKISESQSSAKNQNSQLSEKNKKKQSKNKGKDIKDLKTEAEKFKPTYLKKMSPKKIFADGRRLPPVELLAQKPNNSSVRVFLYDEFLSEQECDGLMKAHDSHVKESSKINPLLCFDTIETLRKHLKAAHKKVKVTPADFIPGTFCVNETFSRQLSGWLKSNWSYSTAFYPGESRFSKIFEYRVKEATQLLPENGGKFQITSYPQGIGYKTHTDCVEGNVDERDRMATILVYLQDVEDGGETKFPELGIWVKPRKGRALVWNNMNEEGKCEPMSIHNAAVVNKGHKYIIQRWYYYKSFYSLGKRPPEPDLPARAPGTPRVNCDEYENGSCRWYDEWNYEHLVDYRNQRINLK
ncbi:prolyl 4-hydroxylase subunit alpha-1-like [Saccostrea echinata]|uniref:prolyl 4-hydroxylase subunit alpha-1-like n=1 Tax=Saccostrea echinata TaxID=191078 RepID=UPI002A811A49|nr:prolyl 4-hydroxylase subunit alpha-1-like [Saccostrea echinata]